MVLLPLHVLYSMWMREHKTDDSDNSVLNPSKRYLRRVISLFVNEFLTINNLNQFDYNWNKRILILWNWFVSYVLEVVLSQYSANLLCWWLFWLWLVSSVGRCTFVLKICYTTYSPVLCIIWCISVYTMYQRPLPAALRKQSDTSSRVTLKSDTLSWVTLKSAIGSR